MWTKQGRVSMCETFFNIRQVNSVVARLAYDFPSGTPDEDLVYGDLDECDFDGYIYQALFPHTVAPAINGGGQAEGTSALLTWTAGGGIAAPQTIKVVWLDALMSDGSHSLMWLKKLASTVTLANPGETFQRYLNLFTDDIAALD